MAYRTHHSLRRAAEREVIISARLTDGEFAAFERRRGNATRSAFLRAVLSDVLQDPPLDAPSCVAHGVAVRPFTAPPMAPRTPLRGERFPARHGNPATIHVGRETLKSLIAVA